MDNQAPERDDRSARSTRTKSGSAEPENGPSASTPPIQSAQPAPEIESEDESDSQDADAQDDSPEASDASGGAVEPEEALVSTEEEDGVIVVGIGASAGGLDALTKFFRAVPKECGLAFVVVQHLSPDHESMMGNLLSKHTAMPVRQARDGDAVKPDHVYLIPPRKNMTLFHGRLFLAEQTRAHGHVNYPIDVFFESMAEDMKSDAVAVILSGTGSDGTRGLRTVKGVGGLVIAQQTDTAQYGGMPESAVSTGLVDQVLPPEDIPDALMRYVRYPSRVRDELEATARQAAEAEDGIAKVLAAVRKRTGVDFSAYKPTTVTRRIEHRMSIRQMPTIEDYAERLSSDPDEVEALSREMLIGVTRFFRDTDAWKTLVETAFPRIVENAEKTGRDDVRCWVVGCSTGEEAYTLAILLHEYVERQGSQVGVKVFATDVDQEALRTAASGVYPDSISADVSPERLQRFFVRTGEQYRVSRQLRQSVIFAPHDLLKDPPFSRLDLVNCRNLLIYLKPKRQRKVLANFGYALGTGGFLFLGKSENTGGDTDSIFSTVDGPARIFRYSGGRHPDVAISTDPVPKLRDTTKKPDAPKTRWRHSDSLLEDVFEDALRDHMPPAVVVNDRNRVVHVFGNAEPFLQIPSGQANMDLMRMVRNPLRVLVGTALHRARKTGRRVVYAGVPAPKGKASGANASSDRPQGAHVDLVVDVQKTYDDLDLAVVIFVPVPETSSEEKRIRDDNAVYDVDADTQQRIEALQQRLRYTEENLQATVEELETSNEELQATNQELMASNEELQSTNEELQSVNEELVTVNAELQEKIRKLTEVNDDLDNLLESVTTSSVFLDANLRIRRFTTSAAGLIHLRTGDEGRPIYHLSHALEDVDLESSAREVLETATKTERELQAESGRWYRMRVAPYRTADGRVDGVVLTFHDVTDRKQSEHEAQRLRRRQQHLRPYAAAVHSTADAVVTVDAEGAVTTWNAAAVRCFGIEADDAVGMPVHDLLLGPDADPDRLPLRSDTWRGVTSISRDASTVRFDVQTNPLHHPLTAGEEDGENGTITASIQGDKPPNGHVITARPVRDA